MEQQRIIADRMSVYEGDPGYPQYEAIRAKGCLVAVLLDGSKQEGVVTADREQGWLRRFVMVEGRPQTYLDRFKTEVLRGKVDFVLEPKSNLQR